MVDRRKLDHAHLWRAIDALASRAGLTPSALARRAGLDPTALNKSKRVTGDGRPRWPSTESLSKILCASDATLDDLSRLVDDPSRRTADDLSFEPRFASAVMGFRDGSDTTTVPPLAADLETMRVRDDGMLPLYRAGDVLIIAPSVAPKPGERVLLGLTNRPVGVAIFWSSDGGEVEWGEAPFGEPRHHTAVADVVRLARILWASQ